MNEINFRQAATQVQRAGFNASMVKFLAFEALASAVAAGIYFRSLAWGLAVFVGSILVMSAPGINLVAAEAFNAGWAVVAFLVMRRVDPTEAAAPFLAAGIAYLVAMGCHRMLFQWQRDFG